MVCDFFNIGDTGVWYEPSHVSVEYRVIKIDLLGVWFILRSSFFPCKCPYIYFNFGEEMLLKDKILFNKLEGIETSI